MPQALKFLFLKFKIFLVLTFYPCNISVSVEWFINKIFLLYFQLAQQYLKYQTEIAMFEQTRHELLRELDMDVLDQQSTTQLQEEYKQLSKENVRRLL